MDWNRIEASWDLFKGRVRKKWSKLTDEDLKVIAGRRDLLESKIHERYGFAEEHISKAVDDWSRWQPLEIGSQRAPLLLAKRGHSRKSSVSALTSQHK